MYYFRPKKILRRISLILWKALAARLRITSYLFGGRHPEEEFTPDTWREVILGGAKSGTKDGAFRRVPNTDHVALTREMRATAAVTEDGAPVDLVARTLMAIQDAEALRAKRDVRLDYTIVYLPPRFRLRIMLFICALWVVGAFFLGLACGAPIQLGRSVLKLFVAQEVHDGYALLTGFYLLWMCYLVGKSIDRLDKRRQRRPGDGPRADLLLLVVKRGFLWAVKVAYMALFLGGIIPVLVAFVVELYVVLPVRLALDPGLVPRVRIVDAWAVGLLYANIALQVHRMQPHRVAPGLQNVRDPDPLSPSLVVLIPYCRLLIMGGRTRTRLAPRARSSRRWLVACSA